MEQVAGLFDVTLQEKGRVSFSVKIPRDEEGWSIGAIVGPSGSGKTTIAREAYGSALFRGARWLSKKAVIDGFGDCSIKEITSTLTAVGFSSPPSWVKPYHVLSNGEQFRCNLARALLGKTGLVVFDEFTSVVDRNVAKIGSAAISKAIRKGLVQKRFVAITCHYDILEWLEPDWVVDMATCALARRCLRRPKIRLQIYRCHHSAWNLFSKHHYLSADLNRAARCYVAVWEGNPVAFCAVLSQLGKRKRVWRISRTVCLPDYQGVGIGSRTAEAVAELLHREDYIVRRVTSHPAILGHCSRSPLWKTVGVKPAGVKNTGFSASRFPEKYRGWTCANLRSVVSFEYQGGLELGRPEGDE